MTRILFIMFTTLLFAQIALTSCFTSEDILLPQLPYNYTELQPVISETIMRLHHLMHHQGYITNYNLARKSLEVAIGEGDLYTIELLQNTIKFNLGGHLNHAFFWKVLAPQGKGGELNSRSELLNKINLQFGSLDNMKALFNKKALAIQGSGWCWLGLNKVTNTLEIRETANQDPLAIFGVEAIFGVDVWEHAYYLDYQNKRGNYLEKIWTIANWTQIETNYKVAVLKI